VKRVLVVMAAFVSVSVLGCGGPVVATDTGTPAPVSQEFALCQVTAYCGGGQTVSCYGNPCYAADYQGVSCAGVFTPCPQTTPCSEQPSCRDYENRACSSPGTRMACCRDGLQDSLVCSAQYGRWLYD
jgi:hypothetical protein